MKYVLIFFLVINIVTMCVYGVDKKKAIKNKLRIPEATLILLAAIGGSIGAIIGMKVFHHKTKKAKFFIGVPAILILQIVLVVAVFFLVP